MQSQERAVYGVVLPSVDKIVQAIATRDNAEVLPSGMTAFERIRTVNSSTDELYVFDYW